MADLAYRNDAVPAKWAPNWGAIWAGMFVFVGIWAVFGLLGEAIFASAASPNAAKPVTGMGWGISIWSIVLTIIAMYVGARVTGHLSGARNKHEGLIHGLIMFGLSAVAAAVIVVLGGSALSGGTGVAENAHSSYALTVFADLGWAGFVSLFLGWLAAMWGGSAGVSARSDRVVNEPVNANVRDIRAA